MAACHNRHSLTKIGHVTVHFRILLTEQEIAFWQFDSKDIASESSGVEGEIWHKVLIIIRWCLLRAQITYALFTGYRQIFCKLSLLLHNLLHIFHWRACENKQGSLSVT